MINIDYIRSQFPGLNTDWVLFDNAGGSQILKPVVDRINEHFYTSNVQLGGSYYHSVLAEERHLEAHKNLMRWINARVPTISFVHDGKDSEQLPRKPISIKSLSGGVTSMPED